MKNVCWSNEQINDFIILSLISQGCCNDNEVGKDKGLRRKSPLLKHTKVKVLMEYWIHRNKKLEKSDRPGIMMY